MGKVQTLVPLFRGGQSIPISRPTPIGTGQKIFSGLPESIPDPRRTIPPPQSPSPPAGQHGAREDATAQARGAGRPNGPSVRTGPASERAQRPNGPGARSTCAAPGAWRPNGPGARSTRAAPGAWRPNGPGAGRPNGPGARSTCAAPGAWRPNGPGARRTRAKGAPKGGTRARASGLRLFRPRHRMPSPRLHPLCARLPLRARLSF